jgi:hypothetical protein
MSKLNNEFDFLKIIHINLITIIIKYKMFHIKNNLNIIFSLKNYIKINITFLKTFKLPF